MIPYVIPYTEQQADKLMEAVVEHIVEHLEETWDPGKSEMTIEILRDGQVHITFKDYWKSAYRVSSFTVDCSEGIAELAA